MLSALSAVWAARLFKLPRFGAAAAPGVVLSDGDNRRPRGDGPPDLEELWQDINTKIRALFGGKLRAGGPFGGEPGSGSSSAGFGIGVVVVVLIVLWIGSGFYIVREGYAGVVSEFGKFKYITGSGWQWCIPYPIQSVDIVDIGQVRSVEVGNNTVLHQTNLKDSSMLSEDGNIVDVRFAVQYRVKSPTDFLFNNYGDPDVIVQQAAETAVREIVGRNRMDYVLFEGRGNVANELNQSIQHILDLYRSGIMVTGVTVQSVQPPEQVQAAFDDAVKASQDSERQKNEGQAYANDVIPRARGDAARVIQEAEGYKARVIADAQGDASRFTQVLAEYAKAPAVTRDRMYLDTMQEIFTHSSKVLIDGHASGNLLYLPLDKLIDQSRPSQSSAAPVVPGAAVPVVAAPSVNYPALGEDQRSRDAARSREREGR